MVRDTLKYALFYASKGMEVFPLQSKNKIPLKGFHWDKEATTDRDKIVKWFQEGSTYNIGIACGARSDIVVVDVDAGHGGKESLADLIIQYGELPDTPQALTGGGGFHLIFKHPGVEIRNSASKLAEGIDIRGDGGYIVAPPSIHPNGKEYVWGENNKPSQIEFADMPLWLMTILLSDSEPEQNETTADTQDNKIISGGRNQKLASLAGTMRKRGMSEDAILEALLAENEIKCVPPLSRKEVQNIAKSISRYDHANEEIDQPTTTRANEMEWMFCAAVYSNPDIAKTQSAWLSDDYFTNKKLKRFWSTLKQSGNVLQVANDIGLVGDFIRMQAFIDKDKVIEYGEQVARNHYITSVGGLIGTLTNQIAEGDINSIKTTLDKMSGEVPYSSSNTVTANDAAMDFLDMLDNVGARSIKCGIKGIDSSIGGFERQTMSVLAARPSMGKSTLAWQIARNIAASNKKALFVSLEMSRNNLIAKAACGAVGIRWRDVRDGRATDEQIKAIQYAALDFGRNNADNLLIIDDTNTSDTIWQAVAKERPDFVIVDHLRLVADKQENEVKRLGVITQKMKDISKAYNCHVMILAQLSRGVEYRNEKRPHMSDLRDSGQIEENADLVLMLYRDDYYDNGNTSETEVLVRKFRDDIRNQKIVLTFETENQWFVSKDIYTE